MQISVNTADRDTCPAVKLLDVIAGRTTSKYITDLQLTGAAVMMLAVKLQDEIAGRTTSKYITTDSYLQPNLTSSKNAENVQI